MGGSLRVSNETQSLGRLLSAWALGLAVTLGCGEDHHDDGDNHADAGHHVEGDVDAAGHAEPDGGASPHPDTDCAHLVDDLSACTSAELDKAACETECATFSEATLDAVVDCLHAALDCNQVKQCLTDNGVACGEG